MRIVTNTKVEGTDPYWLASYQTAASRSHESQLIDVAGVVFTRDLKHHSETQWLVLDV